MIWVPDSGMIQDELVSEYQRFPGPGSTQEIQKLSSHWNWSRYMDLWSGISSESVLGRKKSGETELSL